MEQNKSSEKANNHKRKAVITGMGVISPLGNKVGDMWSALLAGKSGVGPITRFDTEGYTTRIAAEVKDFAPQDIIDRKELRRMDITEQYAMVASLEAFEDSGLDLEKLDRDRCGVVIGSKDALSELFVLIRPIFTAASLAVTIQTTYVRFASSSLSAPAKFFKSILMI